ncbi:ribonuclease P/MRP protein subunit POP5 [Penaeus vannamei]|uniref:Ribonuclease P/MRP protein subunit POP5 n=1 Tax=Penaeus vannamei TaxID=6689 RepID=A0A3R7MBF4_PENVA|nr:ribonuclease P/MRP protein subunit POP5-like [Penaeus vannamei]ROT72172.1 Ribonuclease P/MRP protein subunit POP5 [Penaeus vannamei]
MVRCKRRYFVVEVVPEKSLDLTWYGLKNAIVDTVRRLHGDFGVAATTLGFQIKYCNADTLIAFISSTRGPHQLIAMALPHIKTILNQPVVVRTLHLAASMRHGFLFVKKHHEEKIQELEGKLKTHAEKEHWQHVKKKPYLR